MTIQGEDRRRIVAASGNKNNMPDKYLWRTLLIAALLGGTARAIAAETPTAAQPVPAFPATLACGDATCPDTLRAEHELTFISRLSFPVGSALLTRDAANELLRLLVELESFAVIKHIEIVGHADPSGPENFNRWLSEKRAQRVQDFFAQSGVDPRKVSLRGAGSSEPLVGAIDPSEHRRIEVHISLQPFL